tara:strand:- start:39 stop:1628 length:1590 start_codon:yes stop_codon:yes gene_type:complete
MTSITTTSSWSALQRHCEKLADVALADLYRLDQGRSENLCWTLEGLSVDFSRQRLTSETFKLLFKLARIANVEEKRKAMFAGEPINTTEGRPVLHMAPRDSSGLTSFDAAKLARIQRDAMSNFTAAIRSGQETGMTGHSFTDIVNIGIGGSHLGPMMVTRALRSAEDSLQIHYVANIDGNDLESVLRLVDPERTLFLVASKTFTTEETMINAASAREWLTSFMGEVAVQRHFAAISANNGAAHAFGIDPLRVFNFAEWVGGRFSLWSSIGLSSMIAIGVKPFEDLLAGAHAVDKHFVTAPMEKNLPIIMALTDIWNRSFLNMPARVILPYNERLQHLPVYLQQLEMESNGKSVTKEGNPVDGVVASLVFGMTGTNAQHSFYQYLHQGPSFAAAEFIGISEQGHSLIGHHDKLLANMIGQAEALALGSGTPETPYQICPGNRPSTVILLRRLDPFHLGMLLGLYEHKVMVEGAIWGINSFDQYGVELGKRLASATFEAFEKNITPANPSTARSIKQIMAWREKSDTGFKA